MRTASDTNRRVLHAHASESQSRYSSVLTDATLELPSIFMLGSSQGRLPCVVHIPNTSSQIDLLNQGELADESRGLCIGTRPIASP